MRNCTRCAAGVAAPRDPSCHRPGRPVSAFISPKIAAPALLVDAILDGYLDVLVSPALIAELTASLPPETEVSPPWPPT
jgi:hypothetical protein